jgi:hypothetical protein
LMSPSRPVSRWLNGSKFASCKKKAQRLVSKGRLKIVELCGLPN